MQKKPIVEIERLLNSLRAAAEPSRLRILAVLARNELTVSELTAVLVQSQPRMSRHLKLLHEAGLIERAREGAWVFYRLAGRGPQARLVGALLTHLDDDAALARDFARLEQVRAARERQATQYFRDNAEQWHRIRSLYIAESAVEEALLAAAGNGPFEDMLDMGTGSGRMLELFAPRVAHGLGVDYSHEMLALARATLDRSGITHCQIRHGDLFDLAVGDASFDLVTLHQVLHFLSEPAAAIAEAARVLRPGGCLLIADFAPHALEFLRTEHAHRRLGFAAVEVTGWCEDAGLGCKAVRLLEAEDGGADRLTVTIWCARKTAAPELRATARTATETES